MSLLLKFPKVIFDFGAIATLPKELAELGITNPLFMSDQGLVRCGVFAKALGAMPKNARMAVFDDTPENPTIEGVERAFVVYREHQCDGVVAVGGGSVIDSAKLVSVLARFPGPASQYLGAPEKLTAPAAPLIAVPTTAGTGSEASHSAGIHRDPDLPSEGIRSPYIAPRVAICDPDLTLTLPPGLTAGTGMDAFSHCAEGFLSKMVNPPLDAIALDGIGRVVSHIERAVVDGSDRDARWQLMMAALEGGMSICKGLGPVHALAIVFGDRGFNHGVLVAIAMPSVMRFMSRHVGDRMDRLAAAMKLDSAAKVPDAIETINARISLPASLRELGYGDFDVDKAAEDSANIHYAFSRYHPNRDEYKSMIRGFAA
jgi:alcohol dehydrogenase class IV